MEWRPAGWSVCLPMLISPCTIKSRSSLLAPAHPGGPGKRGRKMVVCVCVVTQRSEQFQQNNQILDFDQLYSPLSVQAQLNYLLQEMLTN